MSVQAFETVLRKKINNIPSSKLDSLVKKDLIDALVEAMQEYNSGLPSQGIQTITSGGTTISIDGTDFELAVDSTDPQNIEIDLVDVSV